jgi:hypothetical protein
MSREAAGGLAHNLGAFTMPLQLPNLDDRRYGDLVEEARNLIPTYAPTQWTNHNPSDPGITLIELFAFLSEMLIYRLNRVTSSNVLSFLILLNGPNWDPFHEGERELTQQEREEIARRLKEMSAPDLTRLVALQLPKSVLKLRRLERAVSCEDFETLALRGDAGVARVRCLPRRNLDADLERERPGHVSLIVLPRAVAGTETDPNLADLPRLIAAVENYLEPKLLLTTQLHVVGPRFLEVRIQMTVAPLPDELELNVKEQVVNAVRRFLNSLIGGEDGKGWPFGRDVFVSEIYSLVDQLPGVDFVTALSLTSPTPDRLVNNTEGEMVGIELKPYELVQVQITTADVTVQAL